MGEQLGNLGFSPERERGFFAEAVKKIEANDKAIALLTLLENGYLPNQEAVRSIDVKELVTKLRNKYPTIEDIENALSKLIDSQIKVAFQPNWSLEEYKQAIGLERLQYRLGAISCIVKALSPVYEQFGASRSKENTQRIIDNLSSVDLARGSLSQYNYVKQNLFAALQQELRPDEAKIILEATRSYFDTWAQFFPEGRDPKVEDAIKKIEIRAGLAEKLATPNEELQPEIFELRGTKIEIVHPENRGPIDIYLGAVPPNKWLRVIDARDVRANSSWNARYLLVEPGRFNPENPTTGYKGIRENEQFVVGRENPWRFELPNTVSRQHLRISLRDNTLTIEDLNSTNGTIVVLGKPRS